MVGKEDCSVIKSDLEVIEGLVCVEEEVGLLVE